MIFFAILATAIVGFSFVGWFAWMVFSDTDSQPKRQYSEGSKF